MFRKKKHNQGPYQVIDPTQENWLSDLDPHEEKIEPLRELRITRDGEGIWLVLETTGGGRQIVQIKDPEEPALW